MTREERKIYQLGVFVAAILIIAIVAVLTEDCDSAKKAVFAAEAVADEYFTDETARSPEKGQIRANSAMPCDDPESFKRWYESYSASSEPVGSEEETRQPVVYRINGDEVNPELQRLLFHYLEEAGIEYWYEGALAQMYQESHCQQYAENPNGLDKGIFQYRVTYWDWNDGDIFDVDAQMRRYAAEMAARFNAGLSADEAISRHKTSDYCAAVDALYVQHVRQWLPTMEVVE